MLLQTPTCIDTKCTSITLLEVAAMSLFKNICRVTLTATVMGHAKISVH